MRVLFWTNGFWPRIGGIETQGLRFIEAMQARGHEYRVIAQRDFPNWKDEEEYCGISIRRFDFKAIPVKRELGVIAAANAYIEKILREFQPNIFHLNESMGWSAFAFLAVHRIITIPIILTLHAPILCYQGKFPDIALKIVDMASQICCVSQWVLDEVRKQFPQFRDKIGLIYNGLPQPQAQPSPLLFMPPTLLLLGRLSPEKGFDLALEAFSLLRKEGSNARLIIAGEGDERTKLEHLVTQFSLEGLVHFIGKVLPEEIPSIINQATLVLMPSYFESFGLVALEAMQMGRPVIAFRTGGLQEVIIDGETGLLIGALEASTLCKAIQSLLEDPQKAITMGIRGYKRSLEKFTLAQHADHYEQLYQEMVKQSLSEMFI